MWGLPFYLGATSGREPVYFAVIQPPSRSFAYCPIDRLLQGAMSLIFFYCPIDRLLQGAMGLIFPYHLRATSGRDPVLLLLFIFYSSHLPLQGRLVVHPPPALCRYIFMCLFIFNFICYC